jgi:hypothetical protein
MKNLASIATLLAVTAAAATARADAPPPTPSSIQVDFVGEIQIIPGVPCAGCTLSVEGTPLSVRTGDQGYFVLTRLPPGSWTATVTSEDTQWRTEVPLVAPRLGATSDGIRHTMYLPPIVITKPGAVAGRVEVASTDDIDDVVVAISELGLFVQPNIGGFYLIAGVAPGTHTVTVYNGIQRVRTRRVSVQPGGLTGSASFPLPSRQ